MAKKTAVKELFDRLWDTPKDKFTWYSILQQALSLEREQIIEGYNQGYREAENDYGGGFEGYTPDVSKFSNATDYFNQNYGDEKAN